jgi:prolyl-tRNA synthetase
VEADSGAIGGNFSHEFMVLAHTGEDTIVSCTACEYAANVERAEIFPPADKDETVPQDMKEVLTPGQHTVEEVIAFLHVDASELVKTIILEADGKAVAALVRGDRELNEIKIKNHLKVDKVQLASPEQVRAWTGAPVGFAGPVGLAMPVVADWELSARQGWIVGGNKADVHLMHASLSRDLSLAGYADLRSIAPGDACPRCGGKIETMRGIEVGHVFKLGTKYSNAMNAVYLDEEGKEQTMIMGCYGIGVTRVVAACIEQNHDENGIIFPPPIAPYEAVLVNLDTASEEVCAKVEEVYSLLLSQGLDVLVDDRDERPGVKFKDADLIGCPMQLIFGAKGLGRGVVEVKDRRTGEKNELPIAEFPEAFAAWKRAVYTGWGA